MSDINDFNAAEAKKLVDLHNKSELHSILTDIMCLSEKGVTFLLIRHAVTNETIEELKNRGFEIEEPSGLSIKISIRW